LLLNGINHVATLTNDTDRLHDFYREVFQAHVVADMQAPEEPGIRLSIIDIGGAQHSTCS
jgi:catechol 2,3-dioxygenase-like lactoylglutathione lyase family enzyme